MVEASLSRTRRLVDVSMNQVQCFCGNIIQVRDMDGLPVIVASQQARDAFLSEQIDVLTEGGVCKILSSPLDVIEKYGGGSARCMIAEVFLNIT